MKVLVAVAEVATLEDDFEVDGSGIPDDHLAHGLNEWDDYAVEEAVRIREAGDDVEVVTVTIGPERVEETVRKALAKGADRGIRIWDPALADRPLLDVGTKVRLLAPVVEEEGPDLVLTGVQAADDGFGSTGVALAGAVGYGWAAVVNDLTIEGDVAHVRRELEGGVESLVDVALPAVLTIQTGINEPRYASLRGIRAAQSKPVAERSLTDLGLEAEQVAPTLTLRVLSEPERDDETTYLGGEPTEQAAALAEVLRERGVGVE